MSSSTLLQETRAERLLTYLIEKIELLAFARRPECGCRSKESAFGDP